MMKTRQSTSKISKITYVKEISCITNCIYFNYPAHLICTYCKNKTKNKILGKKRREQKATY